VRVRPGQAPEVAPFADIHAGDEESHGMLLRANLLRE
jgi:hypothetical protein